MGLTKEQLEQRIANHKKRLAESEAKLRNKQRREKEKADREKQKALAICGLAFIEFLAKNEIETATSVNEWYSPKEIEDKLLQYLKNNIPASFWKKCREKQIPETAWEWVKSNVSEEYDIKLRYQNNR